MQGQSSNEGPGQELGQGVEIKRTIDLGGQGLANRRFQELEGGA